MNTKQISPKDLSIIQSFIRHYIGESQYKDSLELSLLLDNKYVMQLSDEDLISFLQNPVWNENINQSISYEVTLQHIYQYHFMYDTDNITVNILIKKKSQNIIPVNIPTFDWNNIDEDCFIESDSPRFIEEILLSIKLGSPDIEHYHLPDKSVSETISIVNINENTENDKFYSEYLGYKHQEELNPKVFQLTHANFYSKNDNNYINISDNINSFVANMKIDGIRTLIVIYNNIVMCYQRNIKFMYIHQQNIKGNYIFDCELCKGKLHLFDCYYYNDKDISEYKYLDRVYMINQFVENYSDFIATKYVSGENTLKYNYNFKQIVLMFEEFFKSKQFEETIRYISNINSSVNIDSKDNYINNILNVILNIPNIDQNISKYISKLKETLSAVNSEKYKCALQLCKELNIPNRLIIVYSPVIIEGLIGYYNQIGYTSNEEFIKKYSILFVNTCRQSKANIPISFTELITDMYNNCEYDNDGIIFTHNIPMLFNSKSTIYYKWKPRDKLSVDVKLEFDTNDMNEINNKRYISTKIMINTTKIKTLQKETEMELNNFNKMLPKCINNDIIQSGDIVEMVPLWNGLKWSYIPLKIRYDKVYTNSKRVIENIYDLQKNFINILV